MNQPVKGSEPKDVEQNQSFSLKVMEFAFKMAGIAFWTRKYSLLKCLTAHYPNWTSRLQRKVTAELDTMVLQGS